MVDVAPLIWSAGWVSGSEAGIKHHDRGGSACTLRATQAAGSTNTAPARVTVTVVGGADVDRVGTVRVEVDVALVPDADDDTLEGTPEVPREDDELGAGRVGEQATAAHNVNAAAAASRPDVIVPIVSNARFTD